MTTLFAYPQDTHPIWELRAQGYLNVTSGDDTYIHFDLSNEAYQSYLKRSSKIAAKIDKFKFETMRDIDRLVVYHYQKTSAQLDWIFHLATLNNVPAEIWFFELPTHLKDWQIQFFKRETTRCILTFAPDPTKLPFVSYYQEDPIFLTKIRSHSKLRPHAFILDVSFPAPKDLSLEGFARLREQVEGTLPPSSVIICPTLFEWKLLSGCNKTTFYHYSLDRLLNYLSQFELIRTNHPVWKSWLSKESGLHTLDQPSML